MSQGAKVASSEAIESFRAALIVYVSKTRPLVEDASDEVSRTREWLQHDRRIHWENLVRRRTRQLEEAQQELFSVSLSHLGATRMSQLAAVQKAKNALQEAQEKLKLIQRWVREFDNRAGPIVKQLEQLLTVLAHDMPKGAAYLSQMVQKVDAYAGVVSPGASLSPPPSVDQARPSKEEQIEGAGPLGKPAGEPL